MTRGDADEIEMMAIYGPCATCGAHRRVEVTVTGDGAGVSTRMALVCSADIEHDC